MSVGVDSAGASPCKWKKPEHRDCLVRRQQMNEESKPKAALRVECPRFVEFPPNQRGRWEATRRSLRNDYTRVML